MNAARVVGWFYRYFGMGLLFVGLFLFAVVLSSLVPDWGQCLPWLP